MVRSVYLVKALEALLAEEQGLVAEMERCQHRSAAVAKDTEEVDEQQQQRFRQSKRKIEEQLHSVRKRQNSAVGSIAAAVTAAFPVLHALCIGPGLGRHPLVFAAVERVMHTAMESNLTLVLDGDALFMLSLEKYSSLLDLLQGYDRCVITPNLMETRRLDAEVHGESKVATARKSEGQCRHIVVQKGRVDTIQHLGQTMQCKEEGGLKRSGGTGSVLAGTIAAFMAWHVILEQEMLGGSSESSVGE